MGAPLVAGGLSLGVLICKLQNVKSESGSNSRLKVISKEKMI